MGPASKEAGLLSATAGGGPPIDVDQLESAAWVYGLRGHPRRGLTQRMWTIQQLLGLTQQMDEDAFLPLRPDEFGPEFPRRMRGLRRLIDDATSRGRDGGWANLSGVKVAPQAWGYGRYVKLGSEDAWAGVWFGVNFNRWDRQRSTPLWLALYDWMGTLDLAEVRRRLEAASSGRPARSD